jgi:two-component system nitrate/nitrite response regulator NarP
MDTENLQGKRNGRSPTIAMAMTDVLMAEAFSHLLQEARFHVIGRFADPGGLVDKVRRARPDVALIDAPVRSDDGASEALGRLREAARATRIVVVTAVVDPPLARALVRYGASGLILRSSGIAAAIDVLWQVCHGQVVFPSAVMTQLSRPNRFDGLSDRQRQVLELLAQGASNYEIATRLYISPNTVKFHLREIYLRLGVRNRVEAARLLQRPAA